MDHRLRLEALAPALAGRSWESNYRLRIGRLNNYDVVLADTSVSRQHAELLFTANGWAVRDMGSTNGTFVNGARVGRVEEKLRQNDILQVGELCFRVAEITSARAISLGDSPEQLCVTATVNQSWDDVARLLAAQKTKTKAGKTLPLTLVQAGRLSYHSHSLSAYLESLLWEVAESLNALPCGVWLRDDKSGFLARQVSVTSGSQPWQADGNDEHLARFTLLQGETVLFHSTAQQRPVPVRRGTAAPLASVICAALRNADGAFGVLQLASALDGRPFDQADLELADALALVLGAGIDHIRQLFTREQELLLQSISTLIQLLNLRDDFSESHPQRVTDYALLLADELHLPEQERFYLRVGGPLHDLARVGMKEEILQKAAPLDAREVEYVRSCVSKAASVLECSPSLVPMIPIVRSHHERWDGTGYPDGLAGTNIPLLGRIVGLAAAFDAMTSDRPHRPALKLDQAFAEIQARSAAQFDPACVEAWLRLRPQIEELFRQRALCTRTLGREALENLRQTLRVIDQQPVAVDKPMLRG
jgi:HD-GYP domain-containing protein (c-di-GMP phosphodiesterase class II)